MTEAVLVGVDSGGTRTNVEILAEGSNPCERSYEIGESLSGLLDPAQYGTCLRKILAPLELHLEEMGVRDRPISVFISAAGYTQWVRDEFVHTIHEVCPMLANGNIAVVGVANDAVSVLLGEGADGIVIAGTGSSVIVRCPDGSLYQVGGHEWVACDYGSAFWIGLRSIRQAYRDLESGVDSVLLQRLRQLYGIRGDDDRQLIARLRDLAIGDANMKREIARFTASVCAAAERGDLSAQNIVKAEAEELADVTAGALRRRYSNADLSAGIMLVQCGSVLANAFYRSSFEAQIEMRLRSGVDQQAKLNWRRVSTGGEAALNLARSLSASSDTILKLDRAHRPAIVRF